ncbi:MAG: phosphoribosylformylglycinamidine cyclo-ligase [Bacillota bacterium]|nr:phosphoribosylformylglycinamidine cyclo-ligase [Bacillota bacterium]
MQKQMGDMSKDMTDSYLSRGVSATKDDVHKAVRDQSRGLFPGAFCKIMPDPAGDPRWCSAIHADGAGTKSSVAYLMYRETGDPAWFAGLAQDALVMNTDDLLCIGAVNDFYVSNTIGRNAHRIDGACLSALINGYDDAITRLKDAGIAITMTGGETADVGDLVRTVICDSTIFVRLHRSQVIDAGKIKPGLAIVGLSSAGTINGEEKENSGIGSNGLTAARHLLLHADYRSKYPESFSDTLRDDQAYCGRWHLDDPLPGSTLSVGEAILSPTRSYLPIIRDILETTVPDSIYGLIHCTGGGQAKCRDFGQPVRIVKDNLFPLPAIFSAIRDSGQMSDQEMYQVFNMGHRLEIYCEPPVVSTILSVCQAYCLDARVVGYTEKTKTNGREVVIQNQGQTLVYQSR